MLRPRLPAYMMMARTRCYRLNGIQASRACTFGSSCCQMIESSAKICFWILAPLVEVTNDDGAISLQHET